MSVTNIATGENSPKMGCWVSWSCITVAELKAIVNSWPETDQYGEPCEVWMECGNNLSCQVTEIVPLNYRENDDGEYWADICIGASK